MKDTYTIEEVAAMSGLSTRTIRSYLADGQLKGEKVDGAWQFTPEQFGAFLSQDMVHQSVQAKAHGLVYDFLLQNRRTAPASCTILDIPTEDEAPLRQKLLSYVNSREGLRFSYRYEKGVARVILVGAPGAVARLVADLPL